MLTRSFSAKHSAGVAVSAESVRTSSGDVWVTVSGVVSSDALLRLCVWDLAEGLHCSAGLVTMTDTPQDSPGRYYPRGPTGAVPGSPPARRRPRSGTSCTEKSMGMVKKFAQPSSVDAASLKGAPRVDGATRVGRFSEQVWGVSDEDSWPLRLAAVEAGKWGCGRPGRRFHCDAYELVDEDGAGTTDRNCRLL